MQGVCSASLRETVKIEHLIFKVVNIVVHFFSIVPLSKIIELYSQNIMHVIRGNFSTLSIHNRPNSYYGVHLLKNNKEIKSKKCAF